ncbi:two pore domain potassium channel family protein [Methylobacterium nonmethylotrophicum]|uniref:Two pore domain potassium channel family protein n=1 Tax=Methylobacterium nonmethylotrophicum TaxID=1141884 RepID=A0A4Z0NNH1_9HYPH|nr:two pore domain potassium channel family protein [Methylobacterium nonmethylotrophicum]TGD97661.1 two pore domain potassium channel family protein [Methylobacterium nonmethylotrophicum]
MVSFLERASGVLVMGIVLLDVFLTVLYARIGTGLIADRAAHLAWIAFRVAAEAAGPRRGTVLSFCGPTILVLYVLLWAGGLTLGAGLIIHPGLGTGVQAANGPTPTDVLAALYAGGSSMAIVGASDFRPTTDAYRAVYLANSLIGMSVTSLVLTYVMQVYGALQQRNALGLQFHLLSGATSDAGELLARLGPRGQFSAGYSHLAALGEAMAAMKEAHHFYPVLFYFRFRQPYYSVSAQAHLALDTASLIRSTLAGEDTAWLKEAAAVETLWRVAQMLVVTLETAFLPGDPPAATPVDPRERQRWRVQWERAAARLAEAGIAVARDEAAARAYLDLRAQWWPHIARLAPAMAYRSDDIESRGPEKS